MHKSCLLLVLLGRVLGAQSNVGELRFTVVDATGSELESSIRLVSQANQYQWSFHTDAAGRGEVKRLSYGFYTVEASRAGFEPVTELVEVRSALPREIRLTLGVAAVQTTIDIVADDTLLDPYRTGSINRIGSETLQNRAAAPPGRSLLDLVRMQPGWLLEANGILHPRGSEYQVQFVMDGVPFTDQRSPSFMPDPDAEGVQSMTVLTANYPAEYGRKLGGVVEVTTARDLRPGFHGRAVASGGSFETAGGHLSGQYGWSRNTLTVGGSVAGTARFLDPPVEQNYSNRGTTDNFFAQFERDLSRRDRVSLTLRRQGARFQVPNEFLQERAAQRQDRNSGETAGQVSYSHIFSPALLADVRAMVRDESAALWSNSLSTPVVAGQDRGFREAYVKALGSAHSGAHELRFGLEADFASLRETFGFALTDPDRFDRETPGEFAFRDRAQNREQAGFAQDLIRLGHWTFSAGLRWDHYRLLVDESAWSPRLGAAWYWEGGDVVFRASYDRVFQTPAFENILLADSDAAAVLGGEVLRLPVRPSRANFFEAGFSKALLGKFRVDANWFRRDFTHYADDELLLNTGVSFPIAFRKAGVTGAEVKVEIPRWGRLSGFAGYSNLRGTGYLPVTGGLFLGEEAAEAAEPGAGHFPISQDQRNTVSGRFRYQLLPRLWLAFGGQYGSGLPVEFTGTRADALQQYGARTVGQVDFERGRVRPNLSLDAAAGFTLVEHEHATARLQADVRNLSNHFNLINFSGLFSGTALAAPRSVSARLQVDF